MAGSGERRDGAELARLRARIVGLLDDARAEVERESEMTTSPPAELLVVDRKAWVGGNVRTLARLFEDVDVGAAEAKILAWEGGAFLGLVSRAVLAQYDPFRDQFLVVYPNLREMDRGDGLRWLVLHELTHVAQFRTAPWIADHIVDLGRSVISSQPSGFGREIVANARERLPDIIRWARQALEGRAEGTPFLDLIPEAQREQVLRLHAIVTLLEGHATHVCEEAGKRFVSDYDGLQRRLEERGKRTPLMRLLESVAGLEMKRQQYVVGRTFCREVWSHGGAKALAPAWTSPNTMPTHDELRDPKRWLERMSD